MLRARLVRSEQADGIACWFVDAAYNEESFFVRRAYFRQRDQPPRRQNHASVPGAKLLRQSNRDLNSE